MPITIRTRLARRNDNKSFASPSRQPPLVKGRRESGGELEARARVQNLLHKFLELLPKPPATAKVAEPADKPGSVVDSHSSRRSVTATLKQPTRRHRGPRHSLPIWSCSRWGLPCRSVAGLAVRSYRTISPLPDPLRAIGGIFLLHFPSARAAQALPGTVPCGARTFLGTLASDATAWPTPPCALSHACAD